MKNQKMSGRLFVGHIIDNDDQKNVLSFLGKIFPKAPEKTLASLVMNHQASVAITAGKEHIGMVVKKLNNLGAKARFVAEKEQPSAENKSSRIDMAQIRRLVLEGFTGKIDPIEISLSYKVGLAVAALCMILLPLIYCALIIGVGSLLVFHILHNLSLFETLHNVRNALLLYLTPIIIGALLLLFMVKPIFARKRSDDHTYTINPQKEPFLYEYVEKVAEVLGAPVPSVISVFLDVNASAGLRYGVRSIFTNELSLNVGLPLIAGSNIHQLTEVIGHELGHFAQGTGMRLSYIIRSVNGWLNRVVYEKDEWDMRIKHWSEEWDIRIGIILYVARFFIWVTRKILWCFMCVGEAISCFMMRQMEFDADRYGLALIGADVFKSSSERLDVLSWAQLMAYEQLQQAWEDGKKIDNLPGLVVYYAHRIPKKEKMKFTRLQNARRLKSIFETHPTNAERIAHAKKYDKLPMFVLDTSAPVMSSYLEVLQKSDPDKLFQESVPSSILFSDFPGICADVTSGLYESA